MAKGTRRKGGSAAAALGAADDPVSLIVGALELAGCKPKRTRNGWESFCPVHGGDDESLSIGTGDDGKCLIHCFAGCPTEAIVEALGLTMADLMPPRSGTGRPLQLNNDAADSCFWTLEQAIAALEKRHGSTTVRWEYRNADGNVVGLVLRWNRPDGSKDIRPLARVGKTWRITAIPEPRPLYRLPQLLEAEPAVPVVVVEGEKTADAAVQCGLLATTSAGGSQAAKKTDWGPLRGRRMIILPDNDDAGRGYAENVAQLATQAGAAEVRILDLAEYAADLPSGGDLADVLESDNWLGLPLGEGATPKDLGRWVLETAAALPSWQPPAEAMQPQDGQEAVGASNSPVLVTLAEVEAQPVQWLWPGRVPQGRITLLAGVPGVGKSFVALDAAARVSTGTPWPDGQPCPRGDVLVLSAEDDPADTIRPRVDAMHADVSRIHLLAGVIRLADSKRYQAAVTLADVDAIMAALEKLPDCRLMIVDPIGAFVGSQIDTNAENQVRAALQPIAELARTRGPAVLVVAHRRKARADAADDAVMGSRAFTGLARVVWHISRDTENKARRFFLPGKNNLAADLSGLAFSIVGEPPRVAWEREPVSMTADDGLAAEYEAAKRGPEARRLAEAEELLRLTLADGPRLAREVYEELSSAGLSKRTIDRAKDHLGVLAYRDRVPGPWLWRLDAAQGCQVAPKKKETWQSWQPCEKHWENDDFLEAKSQGCQVSHTLGKLGHVGSDRAGWVGTGGDAEAVNRLLAEAVESDNGEI